MPCKQTISEDPGLSFEPRFLQQIMQIPDLAQEVALNPGVWT